MKKMLSGLLTVVMVGTLLTGCAAKPVDKPVQVEATQGGSQTAQTKVFTDSAGREITVPSSITKVAISGPLAQIVLYALAPDLLVGVASKWDEKALPYVNSNFAKLPELGQLYGGKGELNLETLLNSGAQVVIDIGEPKDSIKADLDGLQEKTGVPFVHITANLENMGEVYRMLGSLLNRESDANVLAAYCEETYEKTKVIADSVEKVNLLYCVGEKGLSVIAKGSYHAEVIDLLSNNAAVVDNPVSKGSGNEVDMEQLLNWNPDVILFAPGSIYDTVKNEATWSQLKAIQAGKYYEVPDGPYNWMGFPPSVQRYLGMVWMSQLLYPETAEYDLYAETQKYFKLFYHWDLTKEEYKALVAGSVGK